MTDALVASIGLIAISPVLALIAVLVWSSMGRPILFRQLRAGLHGRPFTLFKFRTMRRAVGTDEDSTDDGARLTGLGRFLRAASLDELPELLNVIVGDMSLVGPRPLLIDYLSLYTPEQARRHAVRPGMTGWAQIRGRNSLTWDERLKLDVWYVDHRSPWLDLLILAATPIVVLKRRGISHPGHATMDRFRGSK
ncbi:MAG: sugar transferase [Gemmatimonadales bacterium]|jgi:lipopolysaccharide/colanic/teichoic acid biosynthesis glycosyltransferase